MKPRVFEIYVKKSSICNFKMYKSNFFILQPIFTSKEGLLNMDHGNILTGPLTI